MKKTPHIVLGVTGSIAAYKSPDLVRLMRKRGWEVSVIMTRGATEFITELTLRTLSHNPVAVDMFSKEHDWYPEHISLADRATALVIAPCTANVMAKLAQGLSDDLLSCTALACPAPLVIAPAMNCRMWAHPATQANLKILLERGATVVDPEEGDLACGSQGRGRLASLETIMAVVERVVTSAQARQGG
jgi:phosphopantothenoylcysteine synthetase/decarboxylase